MRRGGWKASPSVKEAFSTDHVKNFDKKDYGLLRARMEEWGGMLFVNLDEKAPPLTQTLGDLTKDLANYPLDSLVCARTAEFHVNANWKIMLENFLEVRTLAPRGCRGQRIVIVSGGRAGGLAQAWLALSVGKDEEIVGPHGRGRMSSRDRVARAKPCASRL